MTTNLRRVPKMPSAWWITRGDARLWKNLNEFMNDIGDVFNRDDERDGKMFTSTVIEGPMVFEDSVLDNRPLREWKEFLRSIRNALSRSTTLPLSKEELEKLESIIEWLALCEFQSERSVKVAYPDKAKHKNVYQTPNKET